MIGTRVLGIDPGEKRIGLAVSDPTGNIANPAKVIGHSNRKQDAREILVFAKEKEVGLIVVGLSTDSEGNVSFQGKKSERLADEIRKITDIEVVLWDESFSTQIARKARIDMGVARKKRSGHLDEIAATVMLQDYLDSRRMV